MTAGLAPGALARPALRRPGFPPDKQAAMARALRIEWWSIF